MNLTGGTEPCIIFFITCYRYLELIGTVFIPVAVRVRLSHERAEEAKKELDALAEEHGMYISDWWLDVEYRFLSRETAGMFAICAENVPGVVRVEVDNGFRG